MMEVNSTNAMYLWENEGTRSLLEDKLSSYFKKAISENKRISREYLYRELKLHAIGIHFYPTSLSYKKYGQQLIAVKAVHDEYLELNLQNYIDTYGIIKVVPLHSPDNEQYEIDTKDIFEIESYK